jgi:hypothetical protein
MAKITSVKIEWDNGDKKTVENPDGLSKKDVARCRSALNDHDHDEDKEPAKK